MLLLQSLYERYTIADLVGFELEKVQTSAQFYRAGFVGEVDKLGEGASDLPLVHQYPPYSRVLALPRPVTATHIDCNMADHRGMIGKSYVLGIMRGVEVVVGALRNRRHRFVVDDESALDVDLDGAGVRDGIVVALRSRDYCGRVRRRHDSRRE